MKKVLIVGVIIAVVLILVGGAGVVYARVRGLDGNRVVTTTILQGENGVIRQFQAGPGGMMQGYGSGYGPGMMGGPRGEYGYGPGMMGEPRGEYGYGPGMMQGYGPGGMMQGYGRGFEQNGGQYRGVMHDYMISAFAEAVGLTTDEVNTRLGNGETFQQIALAQGKTEAELPALFEQVRKSALDQAVATGVITQAQADVMLQHMQDFQGNGFGPGRNGACPMWDGDEQPQP